MRFSVWEVEGGVDGLTCNDHTANDTITLNATLNITRPRLTCESLTIPDCVDRTVYCTFPPKSIDDGTITTPINPNPAYGDDTGEINVK